MGSYTTFVFKARLKKDTPDEVVDLLKRVLIDKDLGHDKVLFKNREVFSPAINHSFFRSERWYMLFLATNFDDEMQGGRMYLDSGEWVIDLATEFKNYENEIGKFINWITPYLTGTKHKEYVGYYKFEEYDSPKVPLYTERY